MKAVKDFPLPNSKCAHELQPLNALLSGNNKELRWTTEALQALYLIKDILAQTAFLSHPKPDAPLWIMTDASNVAVGAVLQHNNKSIMYGNHYHIAHAN